MKRTIALVLALQGVAFLPLLTNGCGSGLPTSSSATPTPTPTGHANVIVNNASTGGCPVRAWLDATGTITIDSGTVYTFSNYPVGPHTLTINTTASVSCGGPVTACQFVSYYSGPTYSGQSCSFTTKDGQNKTASITDNACNQMILTCPYPY